MDFSCGGGSLENQIVENTKVSKPVIHKQHSMPNVPGLNPLCGCVKDSNIDDDVTHFDNSVGPELSILDGHSEDDDTISKFTQCVGIATTDETPVKKALDTIQQTLDDITVVQDPSQQINVGVTTPIHPATKVDQASDQTPKSHARQSSVSVYTSSPSPSFLNPLNSDWKEEKKLMIDTTSNESNRGNIKPLLCPTLDLPTFSSLASLLRRMENGFHVRLTGGPISCLAGEDEVLLYLHPDHSRLCVESAVMKPYSGQEEKKQPETVDFWIELPINDILRLESKKSTKSFSIVLEKEPDCLVYYDFETPTAVDREIVVSTIMIVLDQTHNSQRSIDWAEGGTLDQPIPCSPSLELQPTPFGPLEHPSTLSPGAHQQLSPSQRTQIYNCADKETETSLVIHLEEFASNDQSEYWDSRRISINRETPQIGLLRKDNSDSEIIVVDDIDETRLDFKTSASSTLLTTVPSNSQIATATWCGGNDMCSLALRDIADTCAGIFAIKKAAVAKTPFACTVGSDQLMLIQEFIASALGAPATVYSCIADGDIWNIDTSASVQMQNVPGDHSKTTKDSNGSFIRNRASLLNAQAARLRNLRNEMTFAAALQQSRDRMQFVQSVRSFDDAFHSKAGKGQKLSVATEAADRFHSSPLLKSVVTNMTIQDPQGNATLVAPEEVAFYDSDPEDVRPRRTRLESLQGSGMDPSGTAKVEKTKATWRQKALSGSGFDEIGTSNRLSRRLDEDVIVEMVQAMTNERFTLMWHPTQTDEDSNLKPVCVKVWIEAGVYLSNGSFLLPKLTWSRACRDNIEEIALESLDLLDICRICPTKKVDRQQHPFAITQKSFFIETHTDIHVFQAQSTVERDKIVYGFKLVVARLASLLMLRDIRAAEEFFGAIATIVPGEAPAWTRLKQNDHESVTSTVRNEATNV